ncbi:MAG: DUF4957 domain-containing protein [Alistipes sp.]|nr:DUF4957 domain-containing protein [Alistipes sp.]
MKKMTLKMRLMGGIVAFSMLLGGCAQGFDSDERFTNGVSNQQLEAPVLTSESFALVLAADGSEAIKVEWPVVMGAGGYRVNVDKVAVMENGSLVEIDPVAVPLDGDKTVVELDACSVTFPCEYGYQYGVVVQAMGNEKLNNTESPVGEPAKYLYYTVPTPIPAGADLYEAIKIDQENPTSRAIYVLEPGARYTLSGSLDFKRHNTQIYPAEYDAENNVYNISSVRARVTLDTDGVIKTSSGLQIKNIDFDCEATTSIGIIMCSDNPTAELAGPGGNAYVFTDPIIVENCRFRQVPYAWFHASKEDAWGVTDIRLLNSVVQMTNDGTKYGDVAFIGQYNSGCWYLGKQTWRGSIRHVTVKNSTIWNVKKNSKNRFIRFQNNDLAKCFENAQGSATLENNTIIQVMTGKEFANNTPNKDTYPIIFKGNVIYDCFRLQKFMQSDGRVNSDAKTTNALVGVNTSLDNTDKTRCGKEESFTFDAAMMSAGDGFVDAILDLDKEDGGVNFKAIGGELAPTVGDPRWL